MDAWDFEPALRAFHASGRPLFGTCAGLIVLAREVEGPRQPSLGLVDVTVERNSYGRQRESFEAETRAALGGGDDRLRMVFIRAPRIRRVGPGSRCWPATGTTRSSRARARSSWRPSTPSSRAT